MDSKKAGTKTSKPKTDLIKKNIAAAKNPRNKSKENLKPVPVKDTTRSKSEKNLKNLKNSKTGLPKQGLKPKNAETGKNKKKTEKTLKEKKEAANQVIEKEGVKDSEAVQHIDAVEVPVENPEVFEQKTEAEAVLQNDEIRVDENSMSKDKGTPREKPVTENKYQASSYNKRRRNSDDDFLLEGFDKSIKNSQ